MAVNAVNFPSHDEVWGRRASKRINGVRHIPIGEVKLNMFNTPFFLSKSVLHLREGLHAMPSNFNLQLQRCGTSFAEPLVHATLKVVLEPLLNGLQTRGRTICGLFPTPSLKSTVDQIAKAHGIQFRPPWIHGFRQLHFLKHKLHRRVEPNSKIGDRYSFQLWEGGRKKRKWCPLTICHLTASCSPWAHLEIT